MTPKDILKETAQPKAVKGKQRKQKKVSALGIIFTIILAIVIILLGERVIFDLNKVANPIVSSTDGSSYKFASGLSSEKSGLSNSAIYYPTSQRADYLMYKLLIHSAFIIPIFLLTFLLYYMFNVKKRQPNWFVAMYGYLVFAFWMLFHLLIEIMVVINYQFPNSAIYIILGILAVIFTSLTVFMQKKVVHRNNS
ncbi:MAG: hypothetical protein ABIF80_04140 [Patescibacteria group bacterium]|nr:DUF1129 domain-containing protein [Patescibacteria group bacterium]MBU2235599.1 DUF1129 domain-containing protein [Patescibacteria group bacterium]